MSNGARPLRYTPNACGGLNKHLDDLHAVARGCSLKIGAGNSDFDGRSLRIAALGTARVNGTGSRE